MKTQHIDLIKKHRLDLSGLCNEDIESKYSEHKKKVYLATLQIIDQDEYLKNREDLQKQCLKKIGSLSVESFLFKYDISLIADKALNVIDSYEKKAMELYLDHVHESIMVDAKPNKLLPILNELSFKQSHIASKAKSLQLEPLVDFKIKRFSEFFSYSKDYLKTKIEFPAPLLQTINSNRRLSLSQIGLIHAINQKLLTKNNANSIAASYGYESGESLYNKYVPHNTPSKRMSEPKQCTHKKLSNKIDLFSSVEPYIEEKYKERLNAEIMALKSHLIKY